MEPLQQLTHHLLAVGLGLQRGWTASEHFVCVLGKDPNRLIPEFVSHLFNGEAQLVKIAMGAEHLCRDYEFSWAAEAHLTKPSVKVSRDDTRLNGKVRGSLVGFRTHEEIC